MYDLNNEQTFHICDVNVLIDYSQRLDSHGQLYS